MRKNILIAAVGLSLLGIFFKIMHWPAANILIIVGSLANLGFGILQYGESKKEEESSGPYLLLTATLCSTILSTLFKTMHWPMGSELALVAILLTMITLIVLTVKSGSVSFQFLASYFLVIFAIFSLMKNNPLSIMLNGAEKTEETNTEQTEDTTAAATTDSAANP